MEKGDTTGNYTITDTGGYGKDIRCLPETARGYDISIKITHVGGSTAPKILNVEVEWEGVLSL